MFSARLARSAAPLRAAKPSQAARRQFTNTARRAEEHVTTPSHGSSKKNSSDLPWVVGSLAVFGPLLFYVSQPQVGGGQHKEHAKEAILHKAEALSEKVPDSVTDAAKGAYDKAASAVGAKSGKAEEVKDKAADKAEDVKDAAKEKAGEAKDKVEEKTGKDAGDLKEKASDVAEAAKDKARAAGNAVRSVAGTKPDDGPVVPKGENRVRTDKDIPAAESNSPKAQSPDKPTNQGSAAEAQSHEHQPTKEEKADQQKGMHQNGGGDGKGRVEPAKTFDDPK